MAAIGSAAPPAAIPDSASAAVSNAAQLALGRGPALPDWPTAPERPLSPQAQRIAEPPAARRLDRWAFSGWVHGRGGGSRALAPGGLLGGSQAGARLGYRVAGSTAAPVSLVARAATPLRRSAGAEAAVGVEWQPLRAIPLRAVVERRQRLGPEGRTAFAAGVHGGVSELPVAAGFRMEAYGQAGAVGIRSRDLFADGAIRVAAPLAGNGTIRVGAGAWGAAQPGAARLDLGPSLSLRLPAVRAAVALDWRFRAAGSARPGSGPAITLSTDF
jgi:hypothetical protein